MPRGFALTAIEGKKILDLHNQNFSQHEISRKIKKSQTCISHFLNDPEGYNKKQLTGCPKILSSRTKGLL